MTRRSRLLHFLKLDFHASLAFATVSFLLTFAIYALALHQMPKHPLMQLYSLVVVFVMFYIRAWFLRRRLARVDAYQAHTYLQNLRMSQAVAELDAVLDCCSHNYDSEHEQCRAFARKQLKTIKHCLSQGPDPVLIRCTPEPECARAS